MHSFRQMDFYQCHHSICIFPLQKGQGHVRLQLRKYAKIRCEILKI